MKTAQSMVVSMRIPTESAKRLKRMASRHGWTPSDASARLVEEGLRRSEFAFIDFRDTPAGRQACIQSSSLAVWEICVPAAGLQAGCASGGQTPGSGLPPPGAGCGRTISKRFQRRSARPSPKTTLHGPSDALKRMLPQTTEFVPRKKAESPGMLKAPSR